jgi:hypothetical protein
VSAYEQYQKFLQTLFSPTDVICFCAIHPTDKGRVLHNFVDATWATSENYFASLNKLNETYNVYVAMNPFKTELQGKGVGRTKENVAKIKRLYIDVDQNGDEARKKIDADVDGDIIPEPSVILNSSPGKYQFIWNVDGLNKDTAEALLKDLARKYAGDPAVAEVARVLRVPGFKNRKYDSLPEVSLIDEMFPDVFAPTDFKIEKAGTATVVPLGFQMMPANTTEVIPRDANGLVPAGSRFRAILQQLGHIHNSGEAPDFETRFDKIYEWANTNCVPAVSDAHRREKLAEYVKGSLTWEPVVQLVMNQKVATEGVQQAPPAEWTVPQPLDSILSPVPPFKLDFLPTTIQPWCQDVSTRMGVPLDFPGICALVTLAGCVGRRVFVYPRANDKEWRESLALSGAVCAHSGRLKTPTWKVFTNVVAEQEGDWRRDFLKNQASYRDAHKAWKKMQKDESAPEMPEPVEPEQPRRAFVNDATPEAFHALMEKNPSGLLYYEDELAGWVAQLDKDGRESARKMFLAAMNGDDYCEIDRIERGTVGAIMCASLFGGIQPDMLVNFLSVSENVSSGLLPRFSLIVWPDAYPAAGTDRRADDGAKVLFRQVARLLLNLPPEQTFMHFDPEAQQLFDAWEAAHNQKIDQERNTGKQSHLSKYKGALPKLAALLQLVDLAALNGTIQGHLLISKGHLQKAIGLLNYLEAHMHRVYDSKRDGLSHVEYLLAERMKNGQFRNGSSAREIARRCWVGLQKVEHVEGALENLSERGWVRIMPATNEPGRPTTRWEVNPAVRRMD